jgi:hypothetical protein
MDIEILNIFQLEKTKQSVITVNDLLPDNIKNWKSWTMEVQFNTETLVFKVGSTKVWEKKWSEMEDNLKPASVKIFGHWHRAYSGTWKQLSLCQGAFLGSWEQVNFLSILSVILPLYQNFDA